MPALTDYITDISSSALAPWADMPPSELTARAQSIVEQLMQSLPEGEYRVAAGIAIHATAVVEPGATLKPPLILCGGAFVAAGAYIRGGCWVSEHVCIGPSSELKSSFVFAGSVLAHFNFVGNSVVGSQVNFEAGAVVCNHRNELHAPRTPALAKFGALIGDGTRIGANAVLAPGTILRPNAVVQRLELVEQQHNELAQPPKGVARVGSGSQ